MKSSILTPLLLVLGLLLLAFVISKVFSNENRSGLVEEIVLPAETADSPPSADEPATETRYESTDTPRELRPATPPGEDTPPSPNASPEGRYLVLAGTFQQLINARTRVRALQQAGFDQTSLEYFDRGTYAVALAGRFPTYDSAGALVEQLRQAGYEAQIMENR
jgi:cell division septation protein DedD